MRSVFVCLLVVVAASAYATYDPTRPPDEADVAAVSVNQHAHLPSLTSVLSSGHRKLAVLDGRVYRLGERGPGFEVISIGRGGVKLRTNGLKTVTLKLSESGVAKILLDRPEPTPVTDKDQRP